LICRARSSRWPRPEKISALRRNLTANSLALPQQMAIFGLAPAEDPRVRRCLLCLSILLTLPCAARAGQLSIADSIRPASLPAIEKVGAGAGAAPVLDLQFDPPVPAGENTQAVMPHAAPVPEAHDTEAPFSLGVKIRSGRERAGPPRRVASDPEEPLTLTDKVEGIVERSTFGVTGTYRF
jgi:hypothetical protein